MKQRIQDRRTKIVATLGPAVDSPEAIAALVDAGADVFRLNFSHGTHADHARRVGWIREVEAAVGRPIAILQDLQGPKIRVGEFADPAGIDLVEGAEFRLTLDDSPGTSERVGVTLPELTGELEPGGRVLLADGLMELRVESRGDGEVVCRVVSGGRLTAHKGINVPDCDLSVPALSAKDIADLEFGATLGVDWVALSFVRTIDDLRSARGHLARIKSPARLMAKIEKPSAVERFAGLLAEVDGVMVARGDLGVEMPPQRVPVVQRAIIAAALAVGKPVIVATQMLESMITNPRPTRAEASDVAHAIYDGADAVMLSGETAVGRWPTAAVAIMDAVALEVEASDDFARQLYRYPDGQPAIVQQAVCHSACRLAEILPAGVIASFTWGGTTAQHLAKHRPAAQIVALTPFERVARQLAVYWGVQPLIEPDPTHTDRMREQALRRLRAAGLVDAGERVVLTAGVPFGVAGTTNLIRVETVAGEVD